MNSFLFPSKKKVGLFLFFIAFFFVADSTTWVFCKECSPKPFLFDFIESTGLGTILWVTGGLFFLPWVSVSRAVSGFFPFDFQGAVFFLVLAVQLYVVSGLSALFFERYGLILPKKFWASIIVLFLFGVIFAVHASGVSLFDPRIIPFFGVLLVLIYYLFLSAGLIRMLFLFFKNRFNRM
ncbi:MAG: hypothetical protein HY917_03915 [Candidatus Diapherotrites archaeon]|nr:hypothetical protein [Candidatus Diapherotrites archaeon]